MKHLIYVSNNIINNLQSVIGQGSLSIVYSFAPEGGSFEHIRIREQDPVISFNIISELE